MSLVGTRAPLAQALELPPDARVRKVYPGVSAQVSGLMLVGQGLARPASRAALPAS